METLYRIIHILALIFVVDAIGKTAQLETREIKVFVLRNTDLYGKKKKRQREFMGQLEYLLANDISIE